MSLISREVVKSVLTFICFTLQPTCLIDIVDGFPKGSSVRHWIPFLVPHLRNLFSVVRKVNVQQCVEFGC